MTIVKRLLCFYKIKTAADNVGYKNCTKFPNIFLYWINALLPVNFKFMEEIYIAKDNKNITSLISIKPILNSNKRFEIVKFYLNNDTNNSGKLLMDYVVSKYAACGVTSILAYVDENKKDVIALFSNKCGFRNFTSHQFFKIDSKLINDSYIFDDIYIEKFKNKFSYEATALYNEAIQPYFRLPLQKSEDEFKIAVGDLFVNKIFRFNIFNKTNNKLCGFIRILTYDNLNYIMDMTLLSPFSHNFKSILSYCYNFLNIKFKNFNLIFKNKKYQINSNFYENYFKENKINMVYREIVLVKDYFNYIKENNETKIQNSKIIFFNDINQNPAFFV